MTLAPVTVISFGFGHPGGQEPAHLVFDVREHFRDPHVSPALRCLTGTDPAVVEAVMATPGVPALTDAITAAVTAFRAGPSPAPVTVAVGCTGGRHRSVVIAAEVARRLPGPVTLLHRDVGLPVIERGTPAPECPAGPCSWPCLSVGAGACWRSAGALRSGTDRLGAVSPAFASCEALFDANPDAVADEGDAGSVLPVSLGSRYVRLVRHDTAAGRFYRLYPVGDDLAVATIAPEGGATGELAALLAAAVPVRIG